MREYLQSSMKCTRCNSICKIVDYEYSDTMHAYFWQCIKCEDDHYVMSTIVDYVYKTIWYPFRHSSFHDMLKVVLREDYKET